MSTDKSSSVNDSKDAVSNSDSSVSNLAMIATENQVGATKTASKNTAGETAGTTLDIPALDFGSSNDKTAAQAANQRTEHPFTYMEKDSQSLAKSTTALDKDLNGNTTQRSADEKQISTELNELKGELTLAGRRHDANISHYQQDVAAGKAAVAKLEADLTALKNDGGSANLKAFNSDETIAQADLKALYQPALDGKSGGGSGSGGGGGGGGGKGSGESASQGLVLNVTGETALKEAIASGMDFSSVRLWDNGVKPGQLINADGSDNKSAWNTLTQLTDTAHSAGKNVTYTFGEPRGDNGAVPSDATVTQWAEQISKWSAQQKADGKGGIDTYELWNEPAYKGYWSGTPAQLAHVTDIMDSVIRKNDPTAKIAAPAVSFWGNNPTKFESEYFQDVEKDMGVKSLSGVFDQVDFHDYTTASTGSIVTDINDMKGVMAQFGLSDKPLVETEAGLYNPETSSTQNANLLAQSYLLSAGNGAEDSVYSYGDKNLGGLPGPGQSQTELNTVQDWLKGATVEKQTDQNGIYTMTIEKDGKQETVAWTTSNTTESYNPGKNYSRYQNADGQWENLDGSLNLTDAPVLLSGY